MSRLLLPLTLLTLAMNAYSNEPDRSVPAALILSNFSNANDPGWYVQNDDVMGGRSSGNVKLTTSALFFKGITNTNGGGFSSIRTQPVALDLSRYQGLKIKLTGDGRRYNWQLRTNATWRGRKISYWAGFDTVANEAITVNIPFTDFVPRSRGTVLDGPVLDSSQIKELGLYIFDKQDGPFSIELNSIQAYTKP